jgi:hypothetical protein
VTYCYRHSLENLKYVGEKKREKKSDKRKKWTRYHKTRQDRTRQGETTQEKTRQDRSGKREERKNLYLVGKVVVNDDVHSLNVDASAEQISGHQNALVEFLRSVRSKNVML